MVRKGRSILIASRDVWRYWRFWFVVVTSVATCD